MTYANNPREAFKAYRKRTGYNATESWRRARSAWLPHWRIHPVYSSAWARGAQNGAECDGLRWIEDADSAFRRVGTWDEIMRDSLYARDLHNGWYTDDEGDTGEVYRGVVYRLISGRGFVAGYECAGPRGARTDHGARLDLREVHSDEKEAARAADHIAERHAEKERDYQAASSAGIRAAELREEVKEIRRDALALCAERRGLCRITTANSFPVAAREIADAIREAWRDMCRKREEIESLRESEGWRNPEAFAESFG